MSATLTSAPAERTDPFPDRSTFGGLAGQNARLLDVVRALIGFGRHLAAALLARDPAENPLRLIRHFGVPTVAEIVERVAYALRLAMVLEMRLTERLSKRVPERAVASARARQRAPGAPRAKRDPLADEPPPDPLPSVEELARAIRHRPVGDVIVDICRNFGIETDHPLYRQVYDALLLEPTNSVIRLIEVNGVRRYAAWRHAPVAGAGAEDEWFWPPAMLLGTGPP